MNYQQAVDYISSFTDYEKVPRLPHSEVYYDLRRVEALLARLGNPHLKARSVHIAGTNGKGSTAAMVASVLTASGYSTGLYTSPHLHTFRERIRVGEELISEAEFTHLVTRLKPGAEAVNQQAAYGELTTFELLTVVGFAYFALKEVAFQVLEVGLGGRLDATNVVKPEVCIITPISLEHTDVLGSTLEAIAAQKAGIIKPGCVVVTSPQLDGPARVIEKACLERGVKLVKVGSDVTYQGLGSDLNRQLLQVKGRRGSYKLAIPLLGNYQLANAATAVAALEVLAEKGVNITKDSLTNGLARVSWPGRLQILGRDPLIVVDGGHNPEAARWLRQSLEQYFSFDHAILVIGVSSDKDMAGIVRYLAPLFSKVIVTQAQHPRAMAPALIATEFAKYGVASEFVDNVAAALSRARALSSSKDLICVTGSLFVVAEAIEVANKFLA